MNELQTVESTTMALNNWDDLMKRAEFFSRSALLPVALRGKPADVAIILQMGWELGIPPMQAVSGITVIQGKPCVDPQLAIALIRSRVPNALIKFDVTTESESKVTMARSRDRQEEAYTAHWTLEKARKMQLLDKDNYKKQPGNMLKWRAVMEAARAVFPDILKGFYSGDEMENAGGDPPPVDKATRLQALAKVEPKEVKAEVAAAAPVVAEASAEPAQASYDPLGDYKIKVGVTFLGKRLSEIDKSSLAGFAHTLQKNADETGNTLKGDWLEAVIRINEYLQGPDPESFENA